MHTMFASHSLYTPFVVCTHYVQYIWTLCEQICEHCVYLVCTLCKPCMYTVYTMCVHCVYHVCTLCTPYAYTVYNLYVHCTLCMLYVYSHTVYIPLKYCCETEFSAFRCVFIVHSSKKYSVTNLFWRLPAWILLFFLSHQQMWRSIWKNGLTLFQDVSCT